MSDDATNNKNDDKYYVDRLCTYLAKYTRGAPKKTNQTRVFLVSQKNQKNAKKHGATHSQNRLRRPRWAAVGGGGRRWAAVGGGGRRWAAPGSSDAHAPLPCARGRAGTRATHYCGTRGGAEAVRRRCWPVRRRCRGGAEEGQRWCREEAGGAEAVLRRCRGGGAEAAQRRRGALELASWP